MADYSALAASVGRFLAIEHLFLGFILVCFGIADYVIPDFFTGNLYMFWNLDRCMGELWVQVATCFIRHLNQST